MKEKKRLGDLLIDEGIITEEQLKFALGKQRELGKKLGNVLIELGIVQEIQIYQALESQFGIPFIDINTINIDPKVPKLITENLARLHIAIPISLNKGALTVAMSDPLDMIAIDDIRFATGMDINIVLAPTADIMRTIQRFYDQTEKAQKAAQEYTAQADYEIEEDEGESEDVTNSPMVRLVNTIIQQAIRAKASDIHIEPFENRVRVRFRIDGTLIEKMTTPKTTHGGIVTRIKIMGKMNISEKRIPQDGRVETSFDGRAIDLRISVLPTVYGEKVVIRLLDRSGVVIDKEQLGFNKINLDRLESILNVPEGIILVTGPTGSGKSTTLYAILKDFNKPETNIITVEDPVEYRMDGVNQVQVNAKAGLTFSSGLRSILRQDPDIVMVGEIRDAETAQIAIRASITGHIVLSTLHTNDTSSTLFRLVDMGIESYLVATATVGIVAQRLVRRICVKCAQKVEADHDELVALGFSPRQKLMLLKGEGCNNCNQSGYSGRVAVHEVLIVDKEIKELMFSGANSDEIKAKAIEGGMMTLRDSCRELVLRGITTVDEMLRVAYTVE